MVSPTYAIRKTAVFFTLMLAMASPAHGQVAETILDTEEEVEVFDTPGDDSSFAPDFAPDPAPVFAPAFSEPARANHRTASPGLYSAEPDVARCEPGTLRNEARAGFVKALNAERARHGLTPVAYDAAWDHEAAAAALIMAANRSLSHEPPSSWRCWTVSGARGAGSSNLLLNTASGYVAPADDAELVAQWLIEGGGDELGHRRWMLDPYLTRTALGRVTQILPDGSLIDSAVMKVFDFSGDNPLPAQVPEFIAWPQGDYPSVFFSPSARLSFSVSQDQVDADAPTQVDFSEAKVSISDGERMVPVRDQLWDNEGYGVANCLSWRMDGIYPDRMYSVEISGLRGAPRDRYRYSFRIVR